VQADSGSLFMDEVSEMSQTMQAKLLRVLQEREITRVGGEAVIRIDVRLIAATNKNLVELVQKGDFREDLFYRLNVVHIKLPPLRRRREDIPLLAGHFLKLFSEKNRKPIKGFTPQAMDQLIKHPWPGNVRELMNAVERAVVFARSEYLDAADLSIIESRQVPEPANSADGQVPPLEMVEKETILKALKASDGNKSETARRLGITRRTLHKKLKKYGVMP